VWLLLDRDDINPDILDDDKITHRRTALIFTVQNEYEALVRLLLRQDNISADKVLIVVEIEEHRAVKRLRMLYENPPVDFHQFLPVGSFCGGLSRNKNPSTQPSLPVSLTGLC
jgi:hypothetical protein